MSIKIEPIAPEEKLAAKIVDYIFTNGQGQQADRLRMVLPDGRDGGGWSKYAVYKIISSMVLAERQKESEGQ